MTQLRKEISSKLRIRRTRAKVTGTAERPRLSVRRSLKHIYVQVIDDVSSVTVASASDSVLKDVEKKGKTKVEIANLVGKIAAEVAKAKGITSVVFDRRDRRYHGRVKAVADGAREAGLEF